jgi:hypothetical protein
MLPAHEGKRGVGKEMGNSSRLTSSSYIPTLIACAKHSYFVSGRTQRVNHIPFNKDEIPVLPSNLDFNRASMAELIQILQDYYVTLWGMSHSSYTSILTEPIVSDYSHKSTRRAPVAILWKDICDHPDRYYNNVTFSPPVKIRDPKDYLDNPVDVFPPLKFFSATAASETPFQFKLQTDGGSAETKPDSSPSGSPFLLMDLSDPPAMVGEPHSVPAASSGSDNLLHSCDSPASSSSSATSSVPVADKVTVAKKLDEISLEPPPATTSSDSPTSSSSSATSSVLVADKVTVAKKLDEISLEPPPATTSSEPPTTSAVPNLLSSSITSSIDHKAASGSKAGKRKRDINPALSTTNSDKVPTSVLNAPSSSMDKAAGKKKGRKRVKRNLLQAPAASTSSTITSPTREIPPGAEQMQVEVEAGGKDLGRRKRKVSRRARGIGYDESTPSPAKKCKVT